MKSNCLYLIAALSPILTLAATGQNPPPAPSPPPTDSVVASAAAQMRQGSPTTHSGRVSAVVYGPQGEVQAFTLRNGVAVTLTPDLGIRLQSSVTKGTRVQVSGMERVVAGQSSLIAQSVLANGQTFVAAAPLADRGPGMAAGTPSPQPAGPVEPRGPHVRRGPGGPPPPPDGAAPPVPPPPDESAPPPPPAGTPPPPPPQM